MGGADTLPPVKFGVHLAQVNPRAFVDVAVGADRLGYESVWMAEHLVLPVEMGGSPYPGADHPPIPPELPVFDAWNYLSFLAARTERVRLGTHVYNLALRHPFVSARAIQTLDIISGGRVEVGVGAGWLASEYGAAGVDFASRGRRLDESIEVCRRLWTDATVEHHGEFFDFGPVKFEPKPVQRPHPPIVVGGDSHAALRRAAHLGDGWAPMAQTPETLPEALAELERLRSDAGRADAAFEVTITARNPSTDEINAYTDAGVDRLIVSPWERSRDALDGLRTFAAAHLG